MLPVLLGLGAWSALALSAALLLCRSVRRADVAAGITDADGVPMPPQPLELVVPIGR